MKKIERIAALEQRVATLEAKLGVVEDKPAKEPKPAIAIGQVWKMRNGENVTITGENTGGFWRTHPWEGVTSNGESFTFSEKGLVELVSDAPTQKGEKSAEADTPVQLPKPYTTPPLRSYWFPSMYNGCAKEFLWDGDSYDDDLLKRGLAFKTEEDAKIALNTILSFLKENTKKKKSD